MQIKRLFEMIYLLMEKGTVTAAELAERFEVSTRTIYRDLDTLSSAGIPVYTCKGKGGGIHLMEDFVLDKSLLSEEEQNEILFALQGLSATQAVEGKALSRLSGLFQKKSVDWIDVDFSHWGSDAEEREKFQLIKTAILEHRILKFTYYSSYGQKSERRVEPVKLRFKNSCWYFQAFCLEKNAYRTFKVCRMEHPILAEEHFLPRPGPVPDLELAGLEPKDLVQLTLWVSPELAFRVYDEFEREQIVRNGDGSFTVTLWFPRGGWVYGYLLSFGDGVQVLSPQGVQKTLGQIAKRIAEQYAE